MSAADERGGGDSNGGDGAATTAAAAAPAPARPEPLHPLSFEAPSPPPAPGLASALAAWAARLRPPRRGVAFTRLASDSVDRGVRAAAPAAPTFPLLSPEDTATLPSRLLFRFVDGLVTAGTSKPLQTEDLWPVSARDAATPVSAAFERALENTGGGGVSLAAAAWATHGRAFVAVGALKFVHDLFLFAGPFLLERLLHHLSARGPPSTAWWLAGGLAACAGAETLTINAYFHALYRQGVHLKAALVDTLFTSALHLSAAARDGTGSGPVATLLSNDAAKLWALPQYLHMLWSAPFQVAVALGLLVRILGWAPSLVGLGITLALIPITTAVTRRLARLRRAAMAATDARVRAAAEVVAGVRAVKLYAWEDAYTARIGAARAVEVAAVRHLGMVNVFNNVLFGGAPVLISLSALLTFAGAGGAVTPAVAFPALALFNLLRFPVIMFPRQLTDIIAGRVALGRLQAFLGAEKVSSEGRVVLPAASPPGTAVIVSGASFAWSRAGTGTGGGPGAAPPTDPPPITLVVPSLTIAAGALVVVVGPVGSGKSSLLAALLGEMAAVAGSVSVAGSLAYAAQDPWIRNQTVRANITWEDWPEVESGAGHAGPARHVADPTWYDTVLDACALRPDLASWPAGDETEIGEKGVTLSGGQRARVALARAVYAKADVILLDDPLSAVDAHVGAHLWDSCLCGVLAGTTRILVTHQVQFAGRADVVVVVNGGAVVAAGPPGSVDLAALLPAAAPPAAPEEARRPPSAGPPTPPRGEVAGAAGVVERVGETPPPLLEPTPAAGGGGGSDHSPVAVRPPLPLKPAGTVIFPTGDGGVAVVPAHQQDAAFVELSLGDDDGGGQRRGLLGGAPASSHHPAEIAPAPAAAGPALLPTSSPAKATAPPPRLRPAPASASLATAQPASRQLPPSTSTLSGRLVKAEERAVGSVHRSVYRVYLSAWGGWALPRWAGACLPGRSLKGTSLLAGPPPPPSIPLPAVVVAIAAAERGLQVAQNLFLAAWADKTAAALGRGGVVALPDPATFMGVYAALGFASLAAQAARAVVTVHGSVAAAAALHDRLLHRVIRLPMSFFDSQPSGRLLNRFSKDTEALDTSLGNTVQSALTCAASSAFAIAVVLGTTPATVVALVPLAWAYTRVQAAYIAASREVKRLDSLAASPIFGGFGEALAGLTTLRAFGVGPRAAAAQRARLDAATRTHWPLMCLNRWLSVRLELLGTAVVFCAAVSAGVLLPTSAGLAGLAITSALTLTGMLAWMVRQATELEVSMNAVERVDEWARLPPEAPAVLATARPPPGWPSAGELVVAGLVVRYRRDLDPALRGISFTVPGGSSLGIAGRTGSGKSTLMLALFRIVEPEAGTVTLDGLDTSKLGLADLRGRGLAAVPQDPVLFGGTVRSNLDPFSAVSSAGPGADAALWAALEAVGLGPAVRAMDGGGGRSGLEARVEEGGANLSVGQRQLLCMSRALLRKPRVLVMDEATSSVDPRADAAVQATIRRAFAGVTMLTIAHRLSSIAAADAVLVLESGRVAELGPPGQLMATPGSLFRGMVEAAGRQSRSGG